MNVTGWCVLWIVLSLVLGVGVLLIALKIMSRRPQLIFTGVVSCRVPDTNIKVRGFRIRNHRKFLGRSTRRETTRIERARLYNLQTKELINAPLVWAMDDVSELSPTCDLGSGESARLYLFARERGAPHCFIYNPSRRSELPDEIIRFTGPMNRFRILVDDQVGRRYRMGVTLRMKEVGWQLHYHLKWRDRIEALRSAARLLWWAVFKRR